MSGRRERATSSTGPLHGVRVVEIGGVGPVPFAAMVLSDLGADVIRVGRIGAATPHPDVMNRGRPSVALDFKSPAGVEAVLRLVEGADILLEGFRPGVMERAGLGPDDCRRRNRRLVYGRMTGYGQDGPLSQLAGHDINYISIAGVLRAVARAGEAPVPPLNLIGDFGGGAMFLVVGVLAAYIEARASGEGQVVDAAMIDGSALLMALVHTMTNAGMWSDEPGTNVLDSGAHFYEVYATADRSYVGVGAIEPQFYARLLDGLGLADVALPDQNDRAAWPAMKARFAEIFRTRTRDEWVAVFDGRDACVTPVLTIDEARRHPHLAARGTFVADDDGSTQPAPAPRFSRTPAAIAGPPRLGGEDTWTALREWGFSADDLDALHAAGAIAAPAARTTR